MGDRICSIDGCDRKARARGWCATHHQRWRLGIDMAPPIHTGPGSCVIEGCDNTAKARGWCNRHYKLWARNGDPTKTLIGQVEQNFWSRVEKTASCWNWTARINASGYGRLWGGSREVLAHRYSYQLVNGEIPDGLPLDHICHNHRCVNPSHLRPVTPKQNVENHSGLARNNTSGVRGVSWSAWHGKWDACVSHLGKKHHKLFHDLTEAEAWVIAKRNELFTHNDLDRTEHPEVPCEMVKHDCRMP